MEVVVVVFLAKMCKGSKPYLIIISGKDKLPL